MGVGMVVVLQQLLFVKQRDCETKQAETRGYVRVAELGCRINTKTNARTHTCAQRQQRQKQ